MKKVTLLGATGSIGQSTLNVIKANEESYKLHSAVANYNVKGMVDIVKNFAPERVAMYDSKSASELKDALVSLKLKCDVLSGFDGVCEIAGDGEAQQVVAAIVGAAGLKPTLEAVKSGVEIGLANKEALVMSGTIFFDAVKKSGSRVIPIDSEHSAIFQSLPEQAQNTIGFCDLDALGVRKILLTGSGGPFRLKCLDEFDSITPAMAVNHPVWSMGPKISVDSATMMNKGLEFIEARYLFNASDDKIEVLLHPQSVVHSMVSYVDGAVLAQLGTPSMQTPIARSLAYPERVAAAVEPLDFVNMQPLSFDKPDFKRYPCLKLAMEASRLGQGATTALNAANEVLVQCFLDEKIRFTDIAANCRKALDHFACEQCDNLDDILRIDKEARSYILRLIDRD